MLDLREEEENRENIPFVEVEPLADEQERLLALEESQTRSRDVLVRRIPELMVNDSSSMEGYHPLREHCESHADLFAEVVVHTDKVVGGGYKDDRVCALYSRLHD